MLVGVSSSTIIEGSKGSASLTDKYNSTSFDLSNATYELVNPDALEGTTEAGLTQKVVPDEVGFITIIVPPGINITDFEVKFQLNNMPGMELVAETAKKESFDSWMFISIGFFAIVLFVAAMSYLWYKERDKRIKLFRYSVSLSSKFGDTGTPSLQKDDSSDGNQIPVKPKGIGALTQDNNRTDYGKFELPALNLPQKDTHATVFNAFMASQASPSDNESKGKGFSKIHPEALNDDLHDHTVMGNTMLSMMDADKTQDVAGLVEDESSIEAS